MASSKSNTFDCPSCQATLAWSEDLVGRQVSCGGCHALIAVPPLEAAQTGGDEYDLLVEQGQQAVEGEDWPVSSTADVKPADFDPSVDAPIESELGSLSSGQARDIEPTSEDPYEFVSDGEYELDSPSTSAARVHQGVCPSCNTKLSDTQVVCMNCGTDARTGEKIATQVQAGADAVEANDGNVTDHSAPADLPGRSFAEPKRKKGIDYEAHAEDIAKKMRRHDVVLPWVAAGVGVLITMVNVFVMAPFVAPLVSYTKLALMIEVGMTPLIRLVVSVPALLLSLYAVAALLGASFGHLVTAVLKLVAVVLLSGSISQSLDLALDWITGGFGSIGWMFKMCVDLFVFVALVIWLFETELLEALLLWFISTIIISVGVFALWAILWTP